MSEIEETPECLNIGPELRFYDDLEHEKERQAELEHFEYGCKNCQYQDGCKWARQFYSEED